MKPVAFALCLCVANAASPAALQAQAASAGESVGWKVTESTNVDGRLDLEMSLRARVPARDDSVPEWATLTLRCRRGRFDALLLPGAALASDTNGRSVVLWRFDEGTSWSAPWRLAATRDSSFMPEPRQFAFDVLRASRLDMEYAPAGTRPVMVTFDVRGVRPHFERARRRCLDVEIAFFSDRPPVVGERLGPAPDTSQIYFEFQVDKAVRPLPGQPLPRYPEELRRQNVQGEVLVQFVVDTLGRADMSSFKVLRSPDPQFSHAVRESVAGHQYRPAVYKGKKVRQLVQQPFNFGLVR